MPQNNILVLAKCADGSRRQLVLIRLDGDVAYVCSRERAHAPDEWLVGFPASDVFDAETGDPIASSAASSQSRSPILAQ